MGTHLTGVYLIGVCFMVSHLMSAYLMGECLMGMHPTGMLLCRRLSHERTSQGRTSHGRVPHGRISHGMHLIGMHLKDVQSQEPVPMILLAQFSGRNQALRASPVPGVRCIAVPVIVWHQRQKQFSCKLEIYSQRLYILLLVLELCPLANTVLDFGLG
jgi:hypothetical protein